MLDNHALHSDDWVVLTFDANFTIQNRCDCPYFEVKASGTSDAHAVLLCREAEG